MKFLAKWDHWRETIIDDVFGDSEIRAFLLALLVFAAGVIALLSVAKT